MVFHGSCNACSAWSTEEGLLGLTDTALGLGLASEVRDGRGAEDFYSNADVMGHRGTSRLR